MRKRDVSRFTATSSAINDGSDHGVVSTPKVE